MSAAQIEFLNRVRPDGPKGISLAKVAALAEKAHAALVPVLRNPGDSVPVPSIVHWRVGHFAAVVGERNGRYEVLDPSSGHLWLGQAVIDAEASGYFLVMAKSRATAGWRRVAAAEAARVWGAGYTKGPDLHCPLCSYDISELSVGVALKDHPVGYAPPKGPSAEVTISYNQWEADQPANFNFFNIGPKWTFNWLTYIQDDPTAPGANVSRYLPGGGADLYSGYDRSTRRFAPAEDDASVLVLQKEAPVAYQRFLTDGSVETYAELDGSRVFPRNVFLTRITDPQGNTLSLNYGTVGGRVRLVSVTDATGRRTTFSYGFRISPLLITRITDPFGRSAVLSYDGSGRLTSITDVIGLTSKFSYVRRGWSIR